MYGDSQKYAAGGLNSVLMQQDRVVDMDMLPFPFVVYCVVFTLYDTYIGLVLFVWFPGFRSSYCHRCSTTKREEKERGGEELGLFLCRTSETLLSHLLRSIDRLAGGLCIDFVSTEYSGRRIAAGQAE